MSTSQIRTFPVASEVFSTLTARASKSSLSLPRSTKASAPMGLLTVLIYLVCFASGLYIAARMYSGALGLVDAQLPRAFGIVYAAAYGLQLFVGYLEHVVERRWREENREENREG